MFGLSTKEKLTALIMNASQDCLQKYIDNIQYLVACNREYISEESIMRVRREYLDDVTNCVFSFFNKESPKTYLRLQCAISSPETCGLDGEYIDIDKGISAGALYTSCYWAITGKTPKPRDCSLLSHAQTKLINDAISRLS